MDKKNIIYAVVPLLIIFILLGAVFLGYYLKSSFGNEGISSINGQNSRLSREPLVMSAGWSSAENETAAVDEALLMLNSKMEDKKVEFAIVYSESSYNNEKILSDINNRLGGETKIYGWTSFKNSVTNGGMKKLSILGFSDRAEAGVGGCSLDEVNYPGENGSRDEIFASARRAAILATQRALDDADKTANDKPRLVLVSGATYFYPGTIENPVEERFLDGIESVLGKDIPIIGGLAADTMASGNEKVFVNDKIYGFGSVSVALLYTDVKIGLNPDTPKIGYGFLGGFTPTTKKGVVTKAEGHLLYEIDGRPCSEVYDEWTNHALGDRINATEWVIDYTALHPLAAKISEDDKVPGYYNKLIHYFNNPQKGVCKVACEVKEGEILYLLEGTPSMFVNRGALTAMFARAEGRLTADEIAGGYMVFCAGSFLAIPEESYPEISNAINETLSGAPFIGGYEFGGFGSFIGAQENVFSTQMASFLVFGKN